MDVLGSVLQELRFESTEYRSLRLGAPFRVSFAEPGLRGVHVVVEGECEVSVSGRPPHRLRAGDLVLFPRGDAHVLHAGRVRGPTQSGVALAMATERGMDVRAGGAGAETLVLCGAFVITRHDHPALAALPEIVHVTEGSGRERWLAPSVDALSAEVFHGGPGSGVVMTRLSDALVARALGFHVEAAQEPGLLLGLGDPYVAGGVRRAISAAGGGYAGGLSAPGPDGAGQHAAARRAVDAPDGGRGGGIWVGGIVRRGIQALHRHNPGRPRPRPGRGVRNRQVRRSNTLCPARTPTADGVRAG